MSDTFDLGGSGGTSFSWGKPAVDCLPGAYVQGTVLDMKEVQKSNYETNLPETWANGDPVMQYRVTLLTELRDPAVPGDTGQRDVYLDGRRKANDDGTKSKLCAVLDAVREATGGVQLQRGGKLTLQWTSGMGFSGDPRCFTAWYEPPALSLGAQPPGVAPAVVQAPPAAQNAQQMTTTQGPPPTWAASPPQAAPPAAGPGPMPTAPPAQVQQQAPPVQAEPTPEAIAALQAAGVDPAQVYPGYVAQPVG